ncbi:MAG TPA: RtcB family protein [Nitrospirota bacterium]|nr:RtcB family protein [Nitrospirota bacterium]
MARLVRLDEYRWQVPQDYKPGMRVPGLIYASELLMEQIKTDQSIEQVANAATLPGIVKASIAMPDMHFGYGLPIGGVVATRMEDGVITPGGVGFDINCGVRVLRTNLSRADIKDKVRGLVEGMFASIPTGVGAKGELRLSMQDFNKMLVKGARWAVENGYGSAEDLDHIEARGTIEGADPDKISGKAYERGKGQLGTLGSGNHFAEIQFVERVFDQKAADALGLREGQVTVMIHTGSRGFGHQVCTDYLRVMEGSVRKYGFVLPDRQLACAPINSPEGRDYLAAMRAAANFGFTNRQMIMHWTRETFMRVLGLSPRDLGMSLIYDVAHNIVKFEEHEVDGKKQTLAVHRKGATRAFPPGHPETPQVYKDVGQPVLIPGDMGTHSYILVGTEKGFRETFGSACHGAGRVMSRAAAVRACKGRAIERELEDIGIIARYTGRDALKEEVPEAYKDIDQVVDVVHNAGIAKRVAKLRPVGVIKG